MPIPSQPVNLIPRPFASEGSYPVIPDAPDQAHGRASFQQGFPFETQLPLAQGGIAPNRMDFQGLFHLLTAFGFWQQSGGLWQYKAELNYAPPALVFHAGKLWWCLKANGPDAANPADKAQVPGQSATCWQEFLMAVSIMSGGSSTLGNPVGTVITFYGTTAPQGYLPCDGAAFSATTYPKLYALLGKANTPDLRGMFVRGYDPAGVNDADGAGRVLGSRQEDAGRNITGHFVADIVHPAFVSASGAFYDDGPAGPGDSGSARANELRSYQFDASRVVPTADENRPKNINLLYCIKHD